MPSVSTSEPRLVSVSWDRLPGWIQRFSERHPETSLEVGASEVRGDSPDGSNFSFVVPFAPMAEASLDGMRTHLAEPWRIGVLLVRKGGFAVARCEGPAVVASKVGQRHVQSRSKAGGWSQQRFARRRDNQAQAAYDAASGYVHELLLPHATGLDLLVTGGDRAAVEAVLGVRALTPLLNVPQRWLPGLPDPKRQILEAAVSKVRSVEIQISDTTPDPR